jgi:translation initiation factor IF-3
LAPEVRLIDQNSEVLGVMTIHEALKVAEKAGLDLVEVAPQSSPPVCKLLDFGKYKYDLKKKSQDLKKRQKTISLKEIKIRPNISIGDLNIKIKHIKGFLTEGHKIKVTVIFRGREIVHNALGMNIMQKILLEVESLARIDLEPRLEGNNINMMLSSLNNASVAAAKK